MSALTNRLPANSSRTRTQAMIVPIKTLIAVTTSETPTVSVIADLACGLVICSQNPERPLSVDLATIAASGMRTRKLRYVAARAPPKRRPPRSGNASGRLLRGRDAEATFDVCHDRVGRVEVLLHHRVPAAELLDGEQARGRRVLLLVGQAGVHRTVAVCREDLLAGRRLDVVQEGLGRGPVLRRLQHRRRVLDRDRLVGDDV